MVSPKFGITKQSELVDLAKKNSDGLNYATFRVGAFPHILEMLFQKAANVKAISVPYKGITPALIDVTAGVVDFSFDNITTSAAQVKAGKVNALAIASPNRSMMLPEAPTLAALGFKGFDFSFCFSLSAPTGITSEAQDRLQRAFKKFHEVRNTLKIAAQSYVQSGRRVVVDVDLEKFFDRVSHDILIDRLQKRIDDAGVILLIRAYLNSVIMQDGMVQERQQGTPQGGPLSPLLANVLLDEVDKELDRRDHCFARYADDCNVYVRSRRAGERVMALLRRLYARLHLTVNESKSAVASVFGRKFLGYSFWVTKGREVRRRVAVKPMATFKPQIRELTRRSGGRSIGEVAQKLRPYLLSWKAYFGLAQTPNVWRTLDLWMRHRLRAIQLKHWK